LISFLNKFLHILNIAEFYLIITETGKDHRYAMKIMYVSYFSPPESPDKKGESFSDSPLQGVML